jgi:hypothetical protein
MPKPVCVKCQRFYRPKKTGVAIVEGMPIGGAGINPPGTAAPEMWKPYKLWQADLWHCLGCGHELVVGFGAEPVRIQHQEDFLEKVMAQQTRFPNLPQINDC